MGTIARTVETTRATLEIKSFQDVFDRPGFLGPADLPYLPPKYEPLLEKTQRILEAARIEAGVEQAEDFVQRTQSGAFAWAGPPGAPETRPLRVSPEQSAGSVLNWFA